MPALSPNTQAILLLTAPLIAGRGARAPERLTHGDYTRLARHLRELHRQPADLLAPDAAELLHACAAVVDAGRLQRLLGRGFLLSQVIEHWRARAIWVMSRADAEYPRRIKVRLREDAPAVLYGCGPVGLLDRGGLAVTGSRHLDDGLADEAAAVARRAARAGRSLLCSGATRIDRAAMHGALQAGGSVVGLLSDGLERAALAREHRQALLDGRLVLASPCDPAAAVDAGQARQRNALICALADAVLVVGADADEGAAWADAIESLGNDRVPPVYVHRNDVASAGLQALLGRGALPWPDLQDADALARVFDMAPPAADGGMPS